MDIKPHINVGLYLNNESISEIDLSNPEDGNPGIGGTQFNFVTLPFYYKRLQNDNVSFTYFANHPENIHQNFDAYKVNNCYEALLGCARYKCDILIWRPGNSETDMKLIEEMDNYNVNVIAWLHNTPKSSILDKLNRCRQLKRYVFVSEEQLDLVRDHFIINKSITIFNGFDSKPYRVTKQLAPIKEKRIVYLGSLIEAKGFGMLAAVWKRITKEYPRAILVVIGSGKLYNRNQKLGEWQVAEESFERKLRAFLSNQNGDKLESVQFLGTLGSEKIEQIQNAYIGVVNPSGQTENCPGSAIEFQACGVPVVSARRRGLLDTVQHGITGLLGIGKSELEKNIKTYLDNPELVAEHGTNGPKFIEDKFNHLTITNLWSKVFLDIKYNVEPIIQNPTKHRNVELKSIKESLRRFKSKYPSIGTLVPNVFKYTNWYFERRARS